MNAPVVELGVLRKKRRPAQSCHQCRKRKVKCDRNSPCQQCVKASINACMYIHDTRAALTSAPFEAEATQFSVFDQRFSANTPSSPTVPEPPILTVDSSTLATSSPRSESSSQNLPTVNPAILSSPIISTVEFDSEFSRVLEEHEAANKMIPQVIPLNFTESVTSTPWLLHKSCLYGKSHWLNYVKPTPEILSAIHDFERETPRFAEHSLADLESHSMSMNKQEISVGQGFRSLLDMVPPKETAYQLVQAYLRTFQTVLGIIDVSSFRHSFEAFWMDSHSIKGEFIATMLLVMCIGSIFCQNDENVTHVTVLQWFHAIAQRLGNPTIEDSNGLESTRILALFILARQVISAKGDIAWLTPGVLIRKGMHIGLHLSTMRSPFADRSPSEIEGRRRLWGAILELELQFSLDCGTAPVIDASSFDHDIPLNVDDESLLFEDPPNPKPLTQMTQSSLQILLLQMMPVRTKIVRFINSPEASSAESATSLHSEFSEMMQSSKALLDTYCMSTRPPTRFQTSLFTILVRRSLLALHNQTPDHPTLAYNQSRKILLQTALSMFDSSTSSRGDDFHQLRLRSSGMFLNIFRESALSLCNELLHHPGHDPFFLSDDWCIAFRKDVHTAISRYIELAEERMKNGDTCFRVYILVFAFVAHDDAMLTESEVGPHIVQGLRNAVQRCSKLMSSRLQGHMEVKNGWLEFDPSIHNNDCDFSKWS